MNCCRVWIRLGAALGVVTFLTGCTLTRAVSQTNVPRERGKSVEAAVERMIFLGLVFDNDDVPLLTKKLADKCPNGSVRGIMTKDLTTYYFLNFIVERRTVAHGYCVNENLAGDGGAEAERSAALESEVAI